MEKNPYKASQAAETNGDPRSAISVGRLFVLALIGAAIAYGLVWLWGWTAQFPWSTGW